MATDDCCSKRHGCDTDRDRNPVAVLLMARDFRLCGGRLDDRRELLIDGLVRVAHRRDHRGARRFRIFDSLTGEAENFAKSRERFLGVVGDLVEVFRGQFLQIGLRDLTEHAQGALEVWKPALKDRFLRPVCARSAALIVVNLARQRPRRSRAARSEFVIVEASRASDDRGLVSHS